MFNFFKKRTAHSTLIVSEDDNEHNDEEKRDFIISATGLSATEAAKISTEQAAQKFAKPNKYTRKIIDDGNAKAAIKREAFNSGVIVKDPYTGERLVLTIQEAKSRYGGDWQKHLAEADHVVPLEEIYDQTKKNPWLTNDDIKKAANSEDNLEVVSRKYNNPKRSRTNDEYVKDKDYLEEHSVELSEGGEQAALESGRKAQGALNRKFSTASVENVIKTAHEAGKHAAGNAGITTVTMSGIMNIAAVIKGEKSAEDAIKDTAVDTGKAAVTGYAMGGSLTTVSHTLSSSSSKFLQALSESNVPGKIITAVMLTGDILQRYGNGEITTQECIIELGEKGISYATVGYSMAIGQALIPIPVVGAAIGAVIGSVTTGKYCNELISTLKMKELEHQERQMIIAEYTRAANEARAYRAELEAYLEEYFRDYQDCFDEALSEIRFAFQIGDADGVIAGANQITRKLGGRVYFDTVDQFKNFLNDDSIDEL